MITIITVVLNDKEAIEQTIQSVISQNTNELEYILIDGSSTDGTLDIIHQHADQIDHIISEPDQGIYDALNKGISLAQGEYIGICHSGDWLEPDIIHKALEKLQLGDIEILTGRMKYWDGDQYSLRSAGPLNHLKRYCSIFHTATLIRRDLFDSVGYYPTDYRIAGDYYWFLDAYLKGVEFTYWEEVVTNFRGGGLSDTHLMLSYQENYKAQQKLLSSPRDLMMSRWFLRYRRCRLWARSISK